MRVLTNDDLNLIAGGTASSDYYPGSVNYPGGGGYGQGGNGGPTGGFGGVWFWSGRMVEIWVDGVIDSSGPVGSWQYLGFNSFGGWSSQGGSGTNGTAVSHVVATHTQDCSIGNGDGAAVQLGRHVTGALPSGISGPTNPAAALQTPQGNTWTNVEFGAVIVNNGNGTYGPLNDEILSDNNVRGVDLAFPTGVAVVGFWHTHTPGGVGATNNYPSGTNDVGPGDANDWDSLQLIKDTYGANNPSFDPSLWLTGPDGITREFKLSERAYFEGLTADQKANGDGLAATARTESCGGG